MTRATAGKARPGAIVGLFVAATVAFVWYQTLSRSPGLEDQLGPGPATRRPGIAIALVVDVSGSMAENVKGADGRPAPKIEIARRAAAALVKKAEEFQRAHPDRTLLLGIYEFSGNRSDTCRKVVEARGG